MDQPLPDDFPEVLRNCFTNLSKVFKVQNSLKRIPDYDGESDQGFNRWLQALELVFQTASAETDVEKKELALQTLSGRAAEFLSRKFRLNWPPATFSSTPAINGSGESSWLFTAVVRFI